MLVEGLVDHIYESEDAAKVPELYRKTSFDWILIDIRMKKPNGLLATKQLKTLFPDAEMILIAEYDDEALRKAAREVGANHYIVKERLIDLVELLRPQVASARDEA